MNSSRSWRTSRGGVAWNSRIRATIGWGEGGTVPAGTPPDGATTQGGRENLCVEEQALEFRPALRRTAEGGGSRRPRRPASPSRSCTPSSNCTRSASSTGTSRPRTYCSWTKTNRTSGSSCATLASPDSGTVRDGRSTSFQVGPATASGRWGTARVRPKFRCVPTNLTMLVTVAGGWCWTQLWLEVVDDCLSVTWVGIRTATSLVHTRFTCVACLIDCSCVHGVGAWTAAANAFVAVQF
jgi:hypothetical protein